MKKQTLLMLTLASILVTAPLARAEDKKGEHFEEHKKQAIASFDARIAALNEAKSCASAASTHEALEACHEKLKAAQEAIAEHAIDSQIEQLQKRKAAIRAKEDH